MLAKFRPTEVVYGTVARFTAFLKRTALTDIRFFNLDSKGRGSEKEKPVVGSRPSVPGDVLSVVDIEIIRRHTHACKNDHDTYIDPETGYAVFTEKFHIKRGNCCGNQCRHCPFGHEKVPCHLRTKSFNSVFYR